jgi:hypothetical protein
MILDDIVAYKRRTCSAKATDCPSHNEPCRFAALPPFLSSVRKKGASIIAEVKGLPSKV